MGPRLTLNDAPFWLRPAQAETLYREIDRKDLAIELRKRMGDWFRVVQLAQSAGAGSSDELQKMAWNNIGHYYSDRRMHDKAAQYYYQAKNYALLAKCYQKMEDYKQLEKLMTELPDGSPLLKQIGEAFTLVGLHELAVKVRDDGATAPHSRTKRSAALKLLGR